MIDKFSIGEEIVLKDYFSYYNPKMNNNRLIPRWEKYPIIDIKEDNIYIRDKDVLCGISSDLVIKYKVYYFINSSGEIDNSLEGKDLKADLFRKNTENYFLTKEEAEKELDVIYRSFEDTQF